MLFRYEGRGQGYVWGKLFFDGHVAGQINFDHSWNGVGRAMLEHAGVEIEDDQVPF